MDSYKLTNFVQEIDKKEDEIRELKNKNNILEQENQKKQKQLQDNMDEIYVLKNESVQIIDDLQQQIDYLSEQCMHSMSPAQKIKGKVKDEIQKMIQEIGAENTELKQSLLRKNSKNLTSSQNGYQHPTSSFIKFNQQNLEKAMSEKDIAFEDNNVLTASQLNMNVNRSINSAICSPKYRPNSQMFSSQVQTIDRLQSSFFDNSSSKQLRSKKIHSQYNFMKMIQSNDERKKLNQYTLELNLMERPRVDFTSPKATKQKNSSFLSNSFLQSSTERHQTFNNKNLMSTINKSPSKFIYE